VTNDVSGWIGNRDFPHLVVGGDGNGESDEHVYTRHRVVRGIEGFEGIFQIGLMQLTERSLANENRL